jgi:hypothetical protein
VKDPIRRRRIPARKTIYAGKGMKSRLEGAYGAHLDLITSDKASSAWNYEGLCYADRHGQYVPDFYGTFNWPNGRPQKWFTEVKPYKQEDALEYMTIIWSSVPDAMLSIVWPNEEKGPYPSGGQWCGPAEWRGFMLFPLEDREVTPLAAVYSPHGVDDQRIARVAAWRGRWTRSTRPEVKWLEYEPGHELLRWWQARKGMEVIGDL